MSSDNKKDIDIGKIIGEQTKEAHKGLHKIIDIWKPLATDPDPCIRVLALTVTLIGFLALIMFLIICIHCIRPIKEFRWVMGILFSFLFLFILVDAPIAHRLSRKAPVNMLASGFEKVYNKKYGASQKDKKDTDQ